MGETFVYNPEGIKQQDDVEITERLSTISGKNIAFLDNLKPQSDKVLQGIYEVLKKHDITSEFYKKIDTPTPLPENVVQEVKNKFHCMITGVGD